MSELYDADIVEWSETQAALLRRAAGGERVNGLDWPNIAEEIESVGRYQIQAVESLLMRALIHMLKAEAWPLSRKVPHWRAEARIFRRTARSRFSPSMRERLDVPRIYRDALHGLPDTIDGVAPLPLPATSPVTLDELLGED